MDPERETATKGVRVRGVVDNGKDGDIAVDELIVVVVVVVVVVVAAEVVVVLEVVFVLALAAAVDIDNA